MKGSGPKTIFSMSSNAIARNNNIGSGPGQQSSNLPINNKTLAQNLMKGLKFYLVFNTMKIF